MAVVEKPSRILDVLTRQHESLRKLIARCERLADGVDDGTEQLTVLWDAADELRQCLDAHNRIEERMLSPVLRELDPLGEVRLERMYLDHIHEHRTMNDQLCAGTIPSLRAALDNLSVHLDSEEHYFLTSRVLRDEIDSAH